MSKQDITILILAILLVWSWGWGYWFPAHSPRSRSGSSAVPKYDMYVCLSRPDSPYTLYASQAQPSFDDMINSWVEADSLQQSGLNVQRGYRDDGTYSERNYETPERLEKGYRVQQG